MLALRTYCFIFVAGLLSACTTTPYQAAEKYSDYDYSPGYLDEEVSPGVYVVEVQGGKPKLLLNKKQELMRMQEHWQKRSKELCQHGYRGESEVITASHARIEAFVCKSSDCQNHPLVSGIIRCHQRFYL